MAQLQAHNVGRAPCHHICDSAAGAERDVGGSQQVQSEEGGAERQAKSGQVWDGWMGRGQDSYKAQKQDEHPHKAHKAQSAAAAARGGWEVGGRAQVGEEEVL